MANPKLYDVIPSIYDTIIDSDNWHSVLERVTRKLDAIGGNILISGNTSDELSALYMSERHLLAGKFYIDNSFEKIDAETLPSLSALCQSRGFVAIPELYDKYNKALSKNVDYSPLLNWMRENLGVHHLYTSPLNFNPAFTDFVTFSFPELNKAKLHDHIQNAEVLLPHFAKASELANPFILLKARFNAVLSVLDRLHLGVAILSPNGSVVLTNKAAQQILEDSDGLGTQNGKVVIHDGHSKGTFMNALKAANRAMDSDNTGHASRVQIDRVSGKLPFIVDVSPLGSRDIDIGGDFKGVLLLMVDPDEYHKVDISSMDSLYSLTKAENAILSLLVSGNTTAEIAEERSTNVDTVRSQVKALFGKTGTRQRSELIRLALSVNIPVDKI